MKPLEPGTTTQHRTVVVPAVDLGLFQAAVALGGGAVIESRSFGNGELIVTYVDGITRSLCRPPSQAA